MKYVYAVALTAITAFAINAKAQYLGGTDLSGFLGINMTEFDGAQTSWDTELGLEAGVLLFYDTGYPVKVRTGAGLVQKKSSAGDGTTSTEFDVTYLEVPLFAYYDFTDRIAGFGGLNFGLKIMDDCSPAACDAGLDYETFNYNLAFGANFRVVDVGRIEGIYEMGMSDIATSAGSSFELGQSLHLRYVHMFN